MHVRRTSSVLVLLLLVQCLHQLALLNMRFIRTCNSCISIAPAACASHRICISCISFAPAACATHLHMQFVHPICNCGSYIISSATTTRAAYPCLQLMQRMCLLLRLCLLLCLRLCLLLVSSHTLPHCTFGVFFVALMWETKKLSSSTSAYHPHNLIDGKHIIGHYGIVAYATAKITAAAPAYEKSSLDAKQLLTESRALFGTTKLFFDFTVLLCPVDGTLR